MDKNMLILPDPRLNDFYPWDGIYSPDDIIGAGAQSGELE